jgi:hypothetical protein
MRGRGTRARIVLPNASIPNAGEMKLFENK